MRLYLDIDGVITADPQSIEGVKTFYIGNAEVSWIPEMFHAFVEKYDVVWATSWILSPGALDTLEYDLGVSFPRVDLERYEYSTTHTATSCGKLKAVQRHYEADPEPFFWVDDHGGAEDQEWARSVGGRMFIPDYYTGGVYRMLREGTPCD